MKIGDYVRTKRGQIHKITDLKTYYENGELIEDRQLVHIDNHFSGWDLGQFKELIVNSSPNIIDLIEVGDYVNGDRVKALKGDIENHKINNEEDVIYTEYINDYDEWCGYEEDEIKSIVTKEQFESMEYKVGG